MDARAQRKVPGRVIRRSGTGIRAGRPFGVRLFRLATDCSGWITRYSEKANGLLDRLSEMAGDGGGKFTLES